MIIKKFEPPIILCPRNEHFQTYWSGLIQVSSYDNRLDYLILGSYGTYWNAFP